MRHAFLFEKLLQLTVSRHLDDDIPTAREFSLDEQLRNRRPF